MRKKETSIRESVAMIQALSGVEAYSVRQGAVVNVGAPLPEAVRDIHVADDDLVRILFNFSNCVHA